VRWFITWKYEVINTGALYLRILRKAEADKAER
jgi:hypothetical protein